MATGALAYQQRTRQHDSPATVRIIQTAHAQSGSSAVSSDAVTSNEYVITLTRIKDLKSEADEDDRPSDYAYENTIRVLDQTARELSLDFPRGSASVGPNRGLRITWSQGLGEVRLVCGGAAENKSYIYSEAGAQNNIEYVVDGQHLAQHLRWALRA
jgi:hypothetical protein